MLSRVLSAAVLGIDAYVVDVEIDLAAGLPTFSTVGLPDAAVRESKDRVVAAVRNSGFDFPVKRITVNLAPADIKKEGACFDLPIAIGILAAHEKIAPSAVGNRCFIGELALDGSLRPVKGVVPIAVCLKERGIDTIILPAENAPEAAVVRELNVLPCSSLVEAVRFLNGEGTIEPYRASPESRAEVAAEYEADFSEVKGQQFAKRALEVAAAGGHNVLMIGPPGSGKTMLAKRLSTILPPMTFEEALEATKIHSVAGILPLKKGLVEKRSFRSPHHTVSNIALIGGGTYPRPGEVSLAHNGVLFLDELTEFHRDVLEVLRQPLEDNTVTVCRAKSSLMFPASFMLVGAMNPCPCGNYGHPDKECLCSPYQIRKYRTKISGPLLDRIDIHLEVPAVRISDLTAETAAAEPSSAIRRRVVNARGRQRERLKNTENPSNSRMNSRQIKKHCALDKEGKQLLAAAVERLGLSARAYDRILKVSRTIADLDNKEHIESAHVAEAVQYRNLDRF